jgi:hypothetical protein
MLEKLARFIGVFLFFLLPAAVWAQQPVNVYREPFVISVSPDVSPLAQATKSAEATDSALTTNKELEKKPDITESTSEVKGKLEKYLMDQKLPALTITNFLKYAIRNAVKQGVPANTIVLILMLPLIAAIIASARHLVGLRGFGIFTPAVISVAFLATGIVSGLLLFGTILLVATFSRFLIRRLRLQYLPRMSLMLWFVCLGVLGIIFLSPFLSQPNLTLVTIFPILIMVLLAENFIEVQTTTSVREAIEITTETLLIALFCYLIMNLEFLQKFVLLNPEITILTVAFYDIFLGKYVGLRLMEYWHFRQIIKNG